MILNIPSDFKLSNDKLISNKIEPIFEKYRKDYIEYYENCKKENSPKIRDSNPVVILYPGVGMFTFAKNKQTSRIASEFYINAINVMRGAEAIQVILPCQDKKLLILNIGHLKKQNSRDSLLKSHSQVKLH